MAEVAGGTRTDHDVTSDLGVTIRAFGPLTLVVQGESAALSRRRERDCLAVLLAAEGRPVSTDRLLDEVWGAEAPATLNPLHVAISRLRTALVPARTDRTQPSPLTSTSAGYALALPTDAVDTWTYAASVTAALATPEPGDALRTLEIAAALWTGDPYGECDAPSVDAVRTHLEELQLLATERQVSCLVELGRAEAALVLARPLLAANPLRERLAATVALAQYLAGSQADALRTITELREHLVEQLGIDPTPEVAELELRLLRQDPALRERAATPTDATRSEPAAASPGDRSASPAGGAELDPTVGREAVTARLVEVLERLRSSLVAPPPVSVLGEPGVGKSRTVAELARLGAEVGVPVVVGRCYEGDTAPALWPWMEVVRSLVAADDSSEHGLGSLLIDGSAVPASEDDGSVLVMFEAISDLLARRARAAAGLVVVIEDLHWADETSLRLLAHLVTTPTSAPLQIVTTRRTTEGETAPALVAAMAALARVGVERIRLDGLDVAGVRALLSQLVGAHPEALDELVLEATAGNPFFVREYARLLRSSGEVADVDTARLHVPDGVREVILQRVVRLPGAGRLLVTAAVIGRDIDPDVLAAVASTPIDEVLDQLDLALASGLVEEQGLGYSFVHALTQDTLAASLSHARRVRIHAATADVLVERSGDAPDWAAMIASHAAASASLGPERTELALTWLGRAASVAADRRALVEARDLYRRAQEIAVAAGDNDHLIAALQGDAAMCVRLGSFGEAPDRFGRIVQLGTDLGRRDVVIDAARTMLDAGAWTWRLPGVTDPTLVDVLTRARDQAPDATDRAILGAVLVIEHHLAWQVELTDEAVAMALADAAASDDPDLLHRVRLARFVTSAGRSDLGDRTPIGVELIAAGPPVEVEVAALLHLAYAHSEWGRMDEAAAAIDRGRALAADLGRRALEVPLEWFACALARDRDDPDAAARLTAAYEATRRTEFFLGSTLLCVHAVNTLAPGASPSDEVVEAARAGAAVERSMVAWALARAGEHQRAFDLLGEAIAPHAADYSVIASLCYRIAALVEIGEHDELPELVARVDAWSTPFATYGSVDHLGSVDHFRALGRAAIGQRQEALVLARAALAANTAAGIGPWARRSAELVAGLRDAAD